MTNQEIVAKLWNLCNVLRDDGITYHQYVTELTFILFLKMAKETGAEASIPENYRWDKLLNNEDGTPRDGIVQHKFYKKLLLDLGEQGRGMVKQIYKDAHTNIREPKNLNIIIKNINGLDWYSAREEGLGNLYEGLLEKNSTESKSGAGQYFTPRPLIDVMVRLINPKAGERCNDPACGTFGFMIAAHQYLANQTDDYYDLSPEQQKFQRTQAFSGCELVPETHRLALMNALLHNMESDITLGDTLTETGKAFKNLDVVLTNPPFGTKKGGEKTTRDDITYRTSNKQLNFLQHIYRSLKADGKARAAVVLPDNVLTADGDGQNVRKDLLEKCNLHTILRLPTGIFYAQGVKTNVLFFSRCQKEKATNTPEVWYYDMRTNMDAFGKRTPLTVAHFADFETAYKTVDRQKIQDERWNRVSLDQIKAKNFSLDFGLIRDDSLVNHEDLAAPEEIAQNALAALERASDNIRMILQELNVNPIK
jgi:type I restriction enzyme M protein